MRQTIALLAAALAAAIPPAARAADLAAPAPATITPPRPPSFVSELRVGGAAQDPWSNERGTANVNGEVLFGRPVLTEDRFWSVFVPRPTVGGSFNTSGRTSYAYVGATWTFDVTERVFVEGFFGGATHDGATGPRAFVSPRFNSLGCSPLFREAGGVRASGSPSTGASWPPSSTCRTRACASRTAASPTSAARSPTRSEACRTPESAPEVRLVALNRIYTRTGDDGTTGLATGERRSKSDLRIETFGTVDETNACLGLARLHARARARRDAGAGPERPLRPRRGPRHPRGRDGRATRGPADRARAGCAAGGRDRPPQRPHRAAALLVLPGGSPAAAALHLARTICRRAERLAVALAAAPGETVSPAALQYLNRLSDFLFVAAPRRQRRRRRGRARVPGANR